MELLISLCIGTLTAGGVYLLLRPRSFEVVLGLCEQARRAAFTRLDECDAGLVARRLDAQDVHRASVGRGCDAPTCRQPALPHGPAHVWRVVSG